MNIAQIEQNLQQLITDFDKATPTNFIYDLLQTYDTPKSTIKRLQDGGLNLSKVEGEVAWKKQLFFKAVQNEDLYELFERIKTSERATKHSPRFVILTDYEKLLALDTKTTDSLDIALTDLPKHFDFFLPWAGMEKAQVQYENPADVKAAERMARLYDEITKDNAIKTKEDVHNLNVFLSRLLFCFFAEDTGIFEKGIFTNSISSHTQTDGSDLNTYLDRLFETLNTAARPETLPKYLKEFPYVNGGLFRNAHHAPIFSRRSRQILISSGELDWSAINPDIFGSMIQAVITPEHRGGLGMHYTSVPNIMKVIEPLFLDELYQEFESAKGNIKKLNELLKRIWNIKIFDPACGSGNFLIIAYKELRKLEMAIFKEIDNVTKTFSTQFSGIHLGNFYGIELDDFAHEVAILSLWLAEHQMNQSFFKEFGRTRPALPLKETGNIVHGNACRVDWESVCRKNEGDEIYILGNPPYLGSKNQSDEQKMDMAHVFIEFSNFAKLDYIACWFKISSDYFVKQNGTFAFVSTNSICQGEQVSLLWPYIFEQKQEIKFGYQSFNWTNNAKDKAGVTCIIVGVSPTQFIKDKKIYTNNNFFYVKGISPYLTSGSNLCIYPRNKPIANIPLMVRGSQPTDDGNLILSEVERFELLYKHPESHKFLKIYMGGDDFINDKKRWCLWIEDSQVIEAENIPPIKVRIDNCRIFRLNSQKEATVKKSQYSYKFDEIKHKDTTSIIFPIISSFRRFYIPIGFLDQNTVISNKAQVIYDAQPFIFSVLTSKLHMLWLSITSSRMRNDYQYSNTLSYNTFPFPPISERQKQELEQSVYRILEEREAHSEKTLAQLYDPDKMPEGLREAHHQNDLAVERCYRSKPFESDEERLEYLFKLYEQMIAEEKVKGTLFEMEKKEKKKKK
ncbi:class I SAM-dependent DNA methyltransferase [Emticicia sp. SJ17W-69]|uniref:class I SAM-dependent DNA methyltransferase n=1 Tax=Emticicia sp. SJ17W-69 TaxID=3421657 RepID=UPI003EB94E28